MTDPSLTDKQIAELDAQQVAGAAAAGLHADRVATELKLARETAKAEVEERQQLHDAAEAERKTRRQQTP